MYRRIILFLIVCTITYCSISIKKVDLNEISQISVEIKGEIEQEQILKLPIGSTVNDVLNLITLKDTADLRSISRFEILKNEQVLVIPKISDNHLISINTGSVEELTKLPGIGEATANAIINYRTTYGYFKTIEQIMYVKGIGKKKYEAIKEYICI